MRTLARRDSLRTQLQRAEDATVLAQRLGADLDRMESRLATLGRRFAAEEIEPDGLVLEVAAGIRSMFERGEWGRRRADGSGIWVTPMYRFSSAAVELIGIARYLSDVSDHAGMNVLDLGGRIGMDVGDGALSAEHSWRSLHGSGDDATAGGGQPEGDRTTRWAIAFEYPVWDKLWVAASFGSDYRRADGKRPVIATIGLNLGFGAIELLPGGRR
jgi:hypothetical protein